MKLSKKTILKGLKQGIVKIKEVNDEVVCEIGDTWFYFAGQLGEELTAKEYVEEMGIKTISKEVKEAIKGLDKYERKYYKYFILENITE